MTDYPWKVKALAIIPKFTGGISVICSSYIVQHVLRSPKKRSMTYHRLLLGISVNDILGSALGFFLSTWPMPAGHTYGAVGTLQTCAMAGFFTQGGNLASPLYNGTLTTFYLLMIVFGWNERRIKKIEPILHAIPLTLGWGLATAGLFLKLYGPAQWVCWISPYPGDCKSSFRYGPDEANCIRGNNSDIYRWAFMYGLTWSTLVYVTVAMIVIYYSVLKKERRTDRYATEGSAKRRTQSKRIANQSMAYVGALYLTLIFGTLTRLLELILNKVYFPIIFLMTIFLPFQGFSNFLIYIRPRYLRYREQHKDLNWCAFMRLAICGSCTGRGTFLETNNCNKKKNGQKDDADHVLEQAEADDAVEAEGTPQHEARKIRKRRLDSDFPYRSSILHKRLNSMTESILGEIRRRLSYDVDRDEATTTATPISSSGTAEGTGTSAPEVVPASHTKSKGVGGDAEACDGEASAATVSEIAAVIRSPLSSPHSQQCEPSNETVEGEGA